MIIFGLSIQWPVLRLPDVPERWFNQLVIGFVAFGFFGLMVGGLTAGWVVSLTQERVSWVSHTYQVETQIRNFRRQFQVLQASRRGYLIDGEPRFKAEFAAAQPRANNALAELRRLTGDNADQAPRITELYALTAQAVSALQVSIADVDAGQQARALQDFATDGVGRIEAEVDKVGQAMLTEENLLLAQREKDLTATVDSFFVLLGVLGVLLALMAVVSVLVILRYTRDLTQSRNSLSLLNDSLEDRVRNRTRDLLRANEEIQRFAYIVSHDLRSPLVNILGFTAELDAAAKPLQTLVDQAEAEAPQIVGDNARRAVREDLPEAINFIRASTQKMDRLINAILKLSREGRRTLAPEPLNMDKLMQDVADTLHHRAADLGVEIVIDKPMPGVTSDRVALDQIFSNLVENSIKYTLPGRPGRVDIRGRREPGRVIYDVADNGRGIDPKDHQRIFDLFRRSGLQDQPGEGIGLAHVRALAYRLGGLINCRSELGQGATFSLSLPETYLGDRTS